MSTRKAKRPGTIEAPVKTIIRETRERVVVKTDNNHKEKHMIITSYETASAITIYIGSYDIYCVEVVLYKRSSDNTFYSGTLNKARWDNACSLGSPFEKGTDTIMILKLLMTYIKDRYPDVPYIAFTDMSTKTCEDGSSVNLAGMKIFTVGKTWYESHFKIHMDNSYKQIYMERLEYAAKQKSEMTFEDFARHSRIHKSGIEYDTLQQIYIKSSTWQAFFSEVRKRIREFNFCTWLSYEGWFDNFLKILRFNIQSLEFLFYPKEYNLSYTIHKNIGGYRNKTMRRRR
jgi:hypothetical protein